MVLRDIAVSGNTIETRFAWEIHSSVLVTLLDMERMSVAARAGPEEK
jgi:hypothetical protein